MVVQRARGRVPLPQVVVAQSMDQRIKAKTLSFLTLLYVVQGLPFGFQATALPVFLRQQGVSLTNIGLLGLLAAPWLLKVLWAPVVDRWWFTGFGRRKTWIVPMQIALAATAAAAAWLDPHRACSPPVGSAAHDLFAATMDIAVDGLAVDVLSDEELGIGNAAQVRGVQARDPDRGRTLVWLSASIGFRGSACRRSVVASATVVTLLGGKTRRPQRHSDPATATTRMTITHVLALIRGSLQKSAQRGAACNRNLQAGRSHGRRDVQAVRRRLGLRQPARALVRHLGTVASLSGP